MITTRTGARWDRAIGWLSLAGIVAVVASLFVTFVQYDAFWFVDVHIDESSFRLADRDPWIQIWTLSLTGLVGFAARSLLVPGRSVGTGIAIVLGMCSAMVETGLFWAADVADSDVSARPGFVLLELGCVSFAVAACLAASRLQDVQLAIPRSLGTAAPTIAAIVIGTVTATALSVRELEALALWGLVLSLTLLTAGACAVSGWLQRRRIPGSVTLTAIGALYAGVVTVFILSQDPSGASEVLFLARNAAMILGATTIPFLSTLVLPRRFGALLLVAWAVSLLADRLKQLQAPMNAPAAIAAASAAALLLAYYLERSPRTSTS